MVKADMDMDNFALLFKNNLFYEIYFKIISETYLFVCI